MKTNQEKQYICAHCSVRQYFIALDAFYETLLSVSGVLFSSVADGRHHTSIQPLVLSIGVGVVEY
ncbi:MAG: hypothetical protein L3J52_02030 [Proteobacteria bacterium]|nr:hypothetical protein [Pseudomonadota bacterium]